MNKIISSDPYEACKQMSEEAMVRKAETISPFFSDNDYRLGFFDGADWKEKQLAENNMLLPFKEYDNLMDSINRRKKEGYEAGYKQGLIDAKEELNKEDVLKYLRTNHSPSEISDFQNAMNIAVAKAYNAGKQGASKVLQCPHFASDGLSRWCMNGHFPCNCEACNCKDKKYVEISTTTSTTCIKED